MIISRSLRATALLALVSSAPLLGAAYVGSAYEGFNYSAGAMANTFGGGTGWNSTGDSGLANTTSWGVGTNLTITGQGAAIPAASLDYTGSTYPAETGASTLVSGATASSSIGRTFGQTVDSGTFYFSYLTKRTNSEFRTVNLSFFGTNERLAIGQFAANANTRDQEGSWLSGSGANTGNFAALISNSQNNTALPSVTTAINGAYVNTAAPQAYSSSSTTLIIGKIEFNFATGVEDRFTLYVVTPGTLTAEASLTPYLTIDHNDFGALSGFRIFAGASGGGFNASGAEFDEVRLGSTFQTVTGVLAIPEPSSVAALAGLAGLSFAASRRRHARD